MIAESSSSATFSPLFINPFSNTEALSLQTFLKLFFQNFQKETGIRKYSQASQTSLFYLMCVMLKNIQQFCFLRWFGCVSLHHSGLNCLLPSPLMSLYCLILVLLPEQFLPHVGPCPRKELSKSTERGQNVLATSVIPNTDACTHPVVGRANPFFQSYCSKIDLPHCLPPLSPENTC